LADGNNATIRTITLAGVVGTLAGTAGQYGSTDATGAAARFTYPTGVALAPSGPIYVADSSVHVIRAVTLAGVVTTLAGTAGQAGSTDATGAAARFNEPSGVAVDASGNVYVTDTLNHTIRKITSAGVVTTLAGTAGQIGSTDGTGAAARFNGPTGVAVDASGNVYVADNGNSTIRKITPAGVVTTVVGVAGVAKTRPAVLPAMLASPLSVALDASGDLYIGLNDAIMKVVF